MHKSLNSRGMLAALAAMAMPGEAAPLLHAPGPTSSRNGGRNHKHMAFVRAARKARNVKRHRAHMKGK